MKLSLVGIFDCICLFKKFKEKKIDNLEKVESNLNPEIISIISKKRIAWKFFLSTLLHLVWKLCFWNIESRTLTNLFHLFCLYCVTIWRNSVPNNDFNEETSQYNYNWNYPPSNIGNWYWLNLFMLWNIQSVFYLFISIFMGI